MKASIAQNQNTNNADKEISFLQNMARKAVFKQMSELQHGTITVCDGQDSWTFGKPSDTCKLHTTIDVLDPQFYSSIAFGGSIGAGEAYMQHEWSCQELTNLIRILVINQDVLIDMEKGWANLTIPIRKYLHRMNRNSLSGSKRNIEAHYDLGNDFYQLFLDETLQYSSAVFLASQMSLKDASTYKMELICKKLQLGPDDHLLEIGTGWGGLAIHAAKHYGCQVTTTTISNEQYKLSQQRIADEGLDDKIDVLLEDYRKLNGQYDKLVSIEMIEAVGHQYYDAFFRQCSDLLKPDGLMLLQSITIADQLYENAKRSVDFIQQYIFPGGCLPSIQAISHFIAQATDLRLLHMDEFAEHYARTLNEWRQRFFENLPKIKELGYSDEFIRMWEYYLCYCEGGFLERSIGVTQMLFAKPLNRSKPTFTFV